MDIGDRLRLCVLLDHFALLEDERESRRVASPLPEVRLLVVCGTIGACDDFDGIVEWGEDNLPFLARGFCPITMATVRHFAFNTLRAVKDTRSLKLRRNKAARNPSDMAQIIGQSR